MPIKRKKKSDNRPLKDAPLRSTRPSKRLQQRRVNKASTSDTPTEIRLQRVLAAAGFGSRRQCETLIEEGRVQVDDDVVQELGTKVDPQKQKIFVDGERVKQRRRQTFAVNKPPGVVSTSRDPAGRAKVIDLIDTDQRVYTVGRLDKSSEGLILVTNDGDLANQLTHPRFGVPKVYHVNVAGNPGRDELELLKKGVHLAEGFAKVKNVRVRKRAKNFTELEIVLDEGRNREIRRLLAKIGHKVLRLRRIAIGPLRLGELPVGGHRRLKRDEVDALLRASQPRGGVRRSSGRYQKSSSAVGRRPRDSGSDRTRGSSRSSGTIRKSSAHSTRRGSSGQSTSGGRRSSTSSAKSASKPTRKSKKPSRRTTGRPAGSKGRGYATGKGGATGKKSSARRPKKR